MPNYSEVMVILLFGSLLLWEYMTGVYQHNNRVKNDWLVDAISVVQLVSLKPLVMLVAFSVGAFLFPDLQDHLQGLPFWLGFLLVFIPDDFSHYWIHRLAHEHPSIWPLHRTHHATTVYQTSIAFRENWLWYVVMPGFWWQGLMVYAGLIEEVVLATAVIGLHNVLLHNGLSWDQKLYKNRSTRAVMKLLEYVVNTPSLHRAHHGLGRNSVPYGNYAQTLFIWDVMFGTATFLKGAAPEYYAVSNPEIMKQRWNYHLWWPLVKRKKGENKEFVSERTVPVTFTEIESD
jgi:sterol desaturase/sphingolipid hydroxylase (fatty acid hydroxylase superfamily)